MNMGKFNYISLEEARTRAMEEKYIVADLRSPKEFYYSHVDNAINVPNPTVEKIAQYNKKDYTWILYCRRGRDVYKRQVYTFIVMLTITRKQKMKLSLHIKC